MPTAYLPFAPEEAQALATAFPQFVKALGTNFPVSGLAFDATTAESAYWKFRAAAYSTGNLVLEIDWYADTASSGAVVWSGAISAITPTTDSQDIETDAFATATTGATTHLGTVGQRLHRSQLAISNLDSIAAEDHVILKIGRLPADAGDTMTGDAIITLATLYFTTTA